MSKVYMQWFRYFKTWLIKQRSLFNDKISFFLYYILNSMSVKDIAYLNKKWYNLFIGNERKKVKVKRMEETKCTS